MKKLYQPDSSLVLEQQMMLCYNSLSKEIADIAINHLTRNVISVKVARQRNTKILERYKEMRNNAVQSFWELLESDKLEDYKISQEDKIRLLKDFITKLR